MLFAISLAMFPISKGGPEFFPAWQQGPKKKKKTKKKKPKKKHYQPSQTDKRLYYLFNIKQSLFFIASLYVKQRLFNAE